MSIKPTTKVKCMNGVSLTKKQKDAVDLTYTLFIKSETREDWSEFDDFMEALDWLSNEELFREASIILEMHIKGDPRCKSNHPREKCVVPKMIEGVDAILNSYEQMGLMDDQFRNILKYYLALTQEGSVLS